MNGSYKELWNVAQEIEGLVCRLGQHAGGVIFVDEPFYESCALMRAPSGFVITQFDLHDAEACGLIKYDILSTEACDKIQVSLELLEKDGRIEKLPLREQYEKYVGVYNIERKNPDMWKMVHENRILSLFQMKEQSGIQGIALTKPVSVDDLAVLNSVIRLMAQEKGGEQPLNKYARFKENPQLWYQEMDEYGLTKEEQRLLEPILKLSYGIAESQERIMQLVQLPECGGFDLTWADSLRKSVAKKDPRQYMALEEEFFKVTEEKGCSKNLCNYVWRVLIAMSRGYSFNLSHTLAYSIVALQEMNIAYKYPIIYWNCANLIVNSGSLEDNSEEEVVDIYEPESDDMANGITFEDLPNGTAKIKKSANTDYGKLATAIGETREAGVEVSLVDVNKSDYGFKPDVENNKILFGLKGLLNVNDDIVKEIITKRPFISIKDFMNRVNPKRQVMLSLIKSGGFDWYTDRMTAMIEYLWLTCDKKKEVNLRNMGGLMKYDLIPHEDKFDFGKRIYEFNRYLKAVCKQSKEAEFYKLDERAVNFLVSIEKESMITEDWLLEVKAWDKIYQGYMNIFREWMKANQAEIVKAINEAAFMEEWETQKGSISAWEMEVLCFYYHEHELANINREKYGISNFKELAETPVKDRLFRGTIPIYKLSKICGTCISKNKNKATATLITTDGVVTVRFRKEHFNVFDRQISELTSDGKKKIIERSWYNRGNMLVIQGYRRGNEFVAKKYANTGHQLYHIDEILPNGDLVLRSERVEIE